MRTINSAVQAAINNTNGIKINARLKVYNNRAFFESAALDSTHVMPGAQVAGILEDTAVLQDCRFDTGLDKVVTVSKVTDSYQLALEGAGTSTFTNSCATNTRPTLIPPYIFHQNSDGSLVKDTYEYINSEFGITVTEIISSAAHNPGSLYGLDSSNAIHIYIDEGGVGIAHYQYDGVSAWVANVCPGRIMFPNEVWASSKSVRLNFAAAAKTDNGIFVYLSSPNGEVIGIQVLPNGNWSDTFIAFPQDLSKFYISNCVVDDDQRIHLCGQFVRTDNWNSGSIYNLSLWSDDGITFSIDRFTLFSTLGYRFMLSLGRSKVIFSDMNRTVELDPCYAYYKESSTSVEIVENISISGTASNGWDVVVGNGTAKYTGHALVTKGNIAKLEVGIQSVGNIVWNQYDNAIIAKIDEVFSNGTRSLLLNIVSEGLWRASMATYPFGMEIQSKQSVRDDASAMDNLSLAPNAHGVKDPFCIAFSHPEAPFGAYNKAAGIGDYWSGDLISEYSLEEYPEIDLFPLTIKIFGWSRLGGNEDDPAFPDTVNASLFNDTFTPLFIVDGLDGNQRTFSIPVNDAVNGVNWPPQTWKPGNSRASSGTYPVVYSCAESSAGFQSGDKIKQVGVRVESINTMTNFSLEKIEIPELAMYMIGTAYGGTLGEDYSWTPIEVPPVTPIDFPPIIFPPIILPPIVYPPIVNPPVIASCGTAPNGPFAFDMGKLALLTKNIIGKSYTIPYQCRLRASTNLNPSKINIQGLFEKAFAIPYSPTYWWFNNTTDNDWYYVQALDKDLVVVATAHFSVTGSPTMVSVWDALTGTSHLEEQRTGIFSNIAEVDICYLKFSVFNPLTNTVLDNFDMAGTSGWTAPAPSDNPMTNCTFGYSNTEGHSANGSLCINRVGLDVGSYLVNKVVSIPVANGEIYTFWHKKTYSGLNAALTVRLTLVLESGSTFTKSFHPSAATTWEKFSMQITGIPSGSIIRKIKIGIESTSLGGSNTHYFDDLSRSDVLDLFTNNMAGWSVVTNTYDCGATSEWLATGGKLDPGCIHIHAPAGGPEVGYYTFEKNISYNARAGQIVTLQVKQSGPYQEHVHTIKVIYADGGYSYYQEDIAWLVNQGYKTFSLTIPAGLTNYAITKIQIGALKWGWDHHYTQEIYMDDLMIEPPLVEGSTGANDMHRLTMNFVTIENICF